jgi:hypothetical protein
MYDLRKTIQIAGIIGGVCLSACQFVSADASEVIRDKQWTIKIRPNGRGNRSTDASSESRSRTVTPAVYQQPAAEIAPAPESVEPAPAPESPKPAGPALPPGADPVAAPASNADPAMRSVDLVPGVMPRTMTYDEAYAAVPFSRTEYEANPTYRHQAALELMFHTLRPTTLVNNFTPRVIRYPDSYQMPYSRNDTQHINIRNFGAGANYNGQSPFGYPYGLKGNW